ncbi:serine/threonine-protein kinase [Nocardia sp. NPDC059240]|uniref:serine/threonine-protein kinase n=1 Tax=Nocardia sp. NPDC059240 TaxID=3346786 RepID=UPI0036A37B6E
MNIGPGSILGGYRIERALGSGGMGTVYLAAHPALPRRDAIKVLWPHMAADPEFRARFEREANLAATLDHPNIVAVHNRGEDEGCLWIALQYVAGTDAATAQGHDPVSMTPMRVLHIITEIGKALDYAHHHGMLHRDVKPANFLLSPQPHGPERVLLADFGIAKPTDGSTELTRTGAFMATVAFASPEQLSAGKLDPRSDQYSLACSFYRLLVGRNPYPGTEALNVMLAHLNEPPPRITALRPELPAALDGVLARALAKDPSQRFGSCLEFTTAAMEAISSAPARTAETVRASAPVRPMDPVSGARSFSDLLSNVGASDPGTNRRPGDRSFAGLLTNTDPAARNARPGAAPPPLTPFDKPLFSGRSSRSIPQEPKPFDHETEWSRSHRVAAWGLGLFVLLVVVMAFAFHSGSSSDESAGAATTTSTFNAYSTSSTQPRVPPSGLQDPCDFLKEDSATAPSRFDLRNTGTPAFTADQRRCDWYPVASGNMSANVTVAAKPLPADPGVQPVRIANELDAQELRAPAATGQSFSTCTISWTTSYGYARFAMNNYFATLTMDELCQRTADLATAIYTSSSPKLAR